MNTSRTFKYRLYNLNGEISLSEADLGSSQGVETIISIHFITILYNIPFFNKLILFQLKVLI